MTDYNEIIQSNPAGVFATKEGGEIKTRVFFFAFNEGNKYYFCTGQSKPVYAQIKDDPNVTFCTYSPDFNPVVSIIGKAVFVNDIAIKEKLYSLPAIQSQFKSADAPEFKPFYIEADRIETFSFQEGPKVYNL